MAKGIISPGEFVHHKVYLTPETVNHPELTLNPDNLELLCRNCHAEEHRKEKARRYKVLETGEVVTDSPPGEK